VFKVSIFKVQWLETDFYLYAANEFDSCKVCMELCGDLSVALQVFFHTLFFPLLSCTIGLSKACYCQCCLDPLS
jgi:hypothetical protein